MNVGSSKVIKELNAYIDQAWGQVEGIAIKHDPALARDLEWIRDCYEALYENADKSFSEDDL